MHLARRPELQAASLITLHSLVLAMLLLSSAAGWGQAVYGTVQTASNGACPGASVVLTPVDPDVLASPRTAITSKDGRFLFLDLFPGTYQLSVRAPGVPAAPPVVVDLSSGTDTDISIRLRAAPPAITILSPASAGPDPTPDEDGDRLLSANGLNPTEQRHAVDGLSQEQAFNLVPAGTGSDTSPDPEGDSDSAERTTGPSYGLGRGRHAGAAYTFSASAVREFRGGSLSYSAARGGRQGSGGVETRSGGADFHGSAFFILLSQALAARQPLATATTYADGVIASTEVKPHDLRKNLGLAVGGPVPRLPRLHYFYSSDAQRRGFPAISSPADPNFYALSAMQTALLGNRGVTPTARNAALNYLSSLTGPTDRRADQTLNFGRLDGQIGRALSLGLAYNRVRWSSPAGLIDAPTVARGRASLGTAAGSVDLLLLHFNLRRGTRLGNAARASYLRDEQYELPQSPLPQEPAVSTGGVPPEVNIGPNGLLFGTPASLSKQAYPDERRIQFSDTLAAGRERHLLELGGDLSFVHDRAATLANAAGTYRYDSGTTGGNAGGLVDFLTDYTFSASAAQSEGCPSIFAATRLPCFRSFSQSFGQSTVAFSTAFFAAFAQDTWHLRPGLTVRAGIRYEYILLPLPQSPNAAIDAIFSSRGATGIFPEDRNNLGPRVGVSWEPLGPGRGILRAGFGVFFGQVSGATLQAALSDTAQPSATTRIRIRPATITACPQLPLRGFNYPCAFTAAPPGIVAATTSAVVFDRRFRLPVIEQGSLSLERELFAHALTLSATYLFNLDRQLPGSTDLNIAPSTDTRLFQLHGGTGKPGVQDGEVFRLPVYTARLSPGFGPVTAVVSDSNATYHAGTLAADLRVRASLRLHGSFTWSRAIDFGQNQSATPRTDSHLDPFNNGYDKGLSSLNYPFALRTDASWSPRIPHAARPLRTLADGWSFEPIVAVRSGRPYSFDLSGGSSLPGGHLSLNGSGGALYLPTVGRNTLRLPLTISTDLRAARVFALRSRLHLALSAEAFNLFNHRNVSSVSQRAYLVGAAVGGVTPLVFQDAATILAEGLTSPPFATPTAASTSLARERQVELSARFSF